MILRGDCLEVMATLPDASVDAVVTDPPYGLSAQPDAAEVLRHWLAGDDYEHTGGGFMGKTWDSFVPGPTVWKECLRVLKPGGHLVAFFGTRTVDLGGMAIRLAGFEIRDCLAWHYGSGFPKSLDVSKAMDKAAGAEGKFGEPKTAAHAGWIERGRMRGEDGHDGYQRPWMKDEQAVDQNARQYLPTTDAAREWQGWGTALKPAFEPIILARKPLIGTVAATVQEFGTGALNVDGCRVEGIPPSVPQPSFGSPTGQTYGMKTGEGRNGEMSQASGRWPANVILDPEAGAMLDAQSGEAGGGHWPNAKITGYGDGIGTGLVEYNGPGPKAKDTGGASRFFYTAKAGRGERNAGLDGFKEQRKAQLAEAEAGYSDPVSARYLSQPMANVHPTVKPIDLMRYLVRLVTPPGGTVLDPFTGSGTTGIAAGLEGFQFTGIEREDEYADIAEARIEWWSEQSGDTAEILVRAGLAEKAEKAHTEAGQLDLLGEAA